MKNSLDEKTVNLALQGGGSHGAFGWGVLDYLLEDGCIEIEGISATSAGAMNAIALAQGLLNNNKEEARELLENFWHKVSTYGQLYAPTNPFNMNWFSQLNYSLANNPSYIAFEGMTQLLSPYQFNPLNFNPLKNILEDMIDFEAIRTNSKLKLHFCATNLETSQVHIFKKDEVSADVVMASACLPNLFQAIEINGEYFWDGGYTGNPAIFPLIYHCDSPDILLISLTPIVRKGLPKTADEIMNRILEISFNASLTRELRAIAFVTHLIEEGKFKDGEMKYIRMHAIRSDEKMCAYERRCQFPFIVKVQSHQYK